MNIAGWTSDFFSDILQLLSVSAHALCRSALLSQGNHKNLYFSQSHRDTRAPGWRAHDENMLAPKDRSCERVPMSQSISQREKNKVLEANFSEQSLVK